MRPLADAQREVLGAMDPLSTVAVDLDDALGLALAESVEAPHDLPPFDNSAMDGFAVRAVDTSGAPVELEVVDDVAAGHVSDRVVEAGTAIKIMTGAPMPLGADAVVIVEETEPGADGGVVVRSSVVPGAAVRAAGGDLVAGATVLEAGERLDPARIGLLASIGVARPSVRRRPVVSVLSTGDEVLPPGTEELRPGTIRDSNRPMLVGLLRDLGAEVVDLGIVADDARLLRSTLEETAATSDAVLTSGGVSMGDHDLVKQVLAELGEIAFWRVAMQPAKPFAFGFLGSTPLFGLPGNPVSVTVAFEQFVRPALLTRMGATRLFRPRVTGVLAEPVRTNPEKVVFLRTALHHDDGRLQVSLAGGQGSHMLSALAAADGFAVVDVGRGDLDPGEKVDVELFRATEHRTYEEVLRE